MIHLTLLKKLLLIITGLTISFAVHTSNYFHYTDNRIKNNSKSEEFISDAIEANDKVLTALFPYTEPVYSLSVPSNMTYSTAEFQKFQGTYLEESHDAGEAYLDSIVYAGDSLTYGLGLSNSYLGTRDVVAYGGLGVYDYLDYTENPSYNQSEELKSPLEWLKKLNPQTLYIMLGTNGVAVYSNEYHINLYNKMLDRVVAALPNTTIVLVAITPWAESRVTEKFTNQKVDNFNMMVLEMAHERGMYFLNFSEAVRDENGNFSPAYMSSDGIHWASTCKKLFCQFVRTHPIP